MVIMPVLLMPPAVPVVIVPPVIEIVEPVPTVIAELVVLATWSVTAPMVSVLTPLIVRELRLLELTLSVGWRVGVPEITTSSPFAGTRCIVPDQLVAVFHAVEVAPVQVRVSKTPA